MTQTTKDPYAEYLKRKAEMTEEERKAIEEYLNAKK